MDHILHSIERMLQTQLPMARRVKLQVLRRYNVKFSKMRNFTLTRHDVKNKRAQAGGESTTFRSSVLDSTTAPSGHMLKRQKFN
jgi:hypothetical protein